jgi:hypothetical protein
MEIGLYMVNICVKSQRFTLNRLGVMHYFVKNIDIQTDGKLGTREPCPIVKCVCLDLSNNAIYISPGCSYTTCILKYSQRGEQWCILA